MTQGISGVRNPLDPSEFFKKMDTDSDGKVSKTELQAMLESAQTKSGVSGTKDIDQIFTKIDTDEDGSISESENSAAMSAIRKKGPPPPPPGGNMKAGLQNLVSGLSEDSETTSTLTELLESLEESEDEETTLSILEQIREELLSLSENNGDTYNQNGITAASIIQSMIDVKK